MKQPFAKGLILGGAITNAMVVTKGRFPGGHWATHRDAESPLTLSDRDKRYPKPDGKYTFDKLSGVFLTGNATRDDAPIAHPDPAARAARGRARRGRGCARRASTRSPRTRPRRACRPDRQPLQLRAVRRDHRQGRPPDRPEGGDGPVYQIT